MFTSLLPVVITLIPFALIIFLVYRFAGKKAGTITALVFGGILLVLIVVALLATPSSKTKNATTSAGEKTIAQVIREDYPGDPYSVSGRVTTLPDETYNQYIIKITGEYSEAGYTKFNKDVCTRLGDANARLVTTVSKGELSPNRGKAGTCRYWLGLQ